MRYKVILYGINIILSLLTLSVLTECCFIDSRSNIFDQETTGMDVGKGKIGEGGF